MRTELGLVWIVGREPGHQNGDYRQRGNQSQAYNRHPMSREAMPRDPDRCASTQCGCPWPVEGTLDHLLAVVDARVEIGVCDISKEVGENRQRGADQNNRHEQGIVVTERRLDEEPTHTRPREDGLREHSAIE